MTSGQQRSNGSTLNMKETIVHVVADCKSYAEILGDLPAFSSCASEVLEEFIAQGATRVDFAAGQAVWSQSSADQNLYVVVSGSAVLDAGDDIYVALEPGDYFGGTSGIRYWSNTSVVARDDMEVLVIHPQELAQLKRASSRSRHPSNIEWRSELSTPIPRFLRRRQRHSALAG
jgi:CRP-like cAMP-binding protein